MTNVVMCPSHLVDKWRREVEKLVPNAKGYIIHNVQDLIAIERKIKNKHKLENSYLIISKESAKFSYEMRPCTRWSTVKDTFVCPCCGQPLEKDESYINYSGRRQSRKAKFNKFDMLKQLAMNSHCTNKVKRYNTSLSSYEEVDCKTALWAPLNKYDTNTGWIKLGKSGWILLKHIDSIYERFTAITTLTRKEAELFSRISELKDTIDSGEDIKGIRAPRKYSIAKHIRERFKGSIDYFLADELEYWLLTQQCVCKIRLIAGNS